MICVRYKIARGACSLAINGHEPDAEHGQALICAAVSALFQGLIVALINLAHAYPQAIDIEGDPAPVVSPDGSRYAAGANGD
jgi:uncharacterized protein YsxB (DUF464 family)